MPITCKKATFIYANQLIYEYFYRVCCAEITEDSSMLAVGFNDSIVKVWTLVPQKLKTMKSAEQLEEVNIEAEDVLVSCCSI